MKGFAPNQHFPQPPPPYTAASLNPALDEQGILGGLAVDGGILWCATEVVSKEEIDRAVAIIKEVC